MKSNPMPMKEPPLVSVMSEILVVLNGVVHGAVLHELCALIVGTALLSHVVGVLHEEHIQQYGVRCSPVLLWHFRQHRRLVVGAGPHKCHEVWHIEPCVRIGL